MTQLHKLALAIVALLFLAPVTFVVAFAARGEADPWGVACLGALSLGLLALPLAACRTARAALWLYAPLAPYAIGLVAFVPVLGYWPHEGAAVALFATSIRGYLEFLQAFGPALLVPLTLVLLYAWCCLQPAYGQLVLDRRLRRGVVLGSLAAAVAALAGQRAWGLAPAFTMANLERAYPSAVVFDAMRLLPAGHGQLAHQRFHAYEQRLVREREVHVLVLGESSRDDHWQVEGYGRPTSPRLMAYGPDALVTFPDAAAVANLTLNVWPIALSRATLAHQEPAWQEHSLVTLFKEAGYDTAWLSNQNASVKQAFDADRQQFLNHAWQTNWDALDSALLPLLDAELARHEARQLIVLHLMGEHGDYRFRYGKRHDVFGDHTKPGGVYTRAQRGRLIDEYDNAIHANDELLDAVVRKVEAQHALSTVTFVSDHGENLFDDERDLVWHGSAAGSRAEAHVPFFIFPGTRWRAANPDKLAALQANRRLRVSQTALFATMADLAGIGYPGADPTRSLASARYVAPVKRWLMRPDHTLVDVATLR